MRVASVKPTELFTGSEARPRQLLRVVLTGHQPGRRALLTAEGPRLRSAEETEVVVGEDGTARAELPIVTDLRPGERCPVRVLAQDAEQRHQQAARDGEFEAAEPGWTMYLVSHFHYDPVGWNTQGAYTETWDAADDPARTGLPARTFDSRGQSGFSLVRAHRDL